MADPATISLLEGALKMGFAAGVRQLAVKFISAITGPVQAIFQDSLNDLEPHLKANYDRCLRIKTILNRQEPVDLLSIYVGTDFKIGNQSYDHFQLIEKMPDFRRVVISGTGGGGKTVFLKYLWLSVFNGSQSKMPIFVELRKINELSSEDLLVYVHRSIIEMRSKIEFEHFKDAVNQGAFCFIFDGFDEIHEDKKASIERQILRLSEVNPAAWIIVSGRPDPRFGSWQNFLILDVQPLTKRKTVELINKLNYDRKIKAKFIGEVKQKLYDSHKSFLSNPLLATMMLLTYDQFAEIPENMFIFYEQAFDTLFLRHDATKEGFQRKKHADLTIDKFKKHLAYFCLFSYYDQRFEFSYSELTEYINKAINVNSSSVRTVEFLSDLIESVCIMQQDGINYVFTHRSFQEYFSAYCLSMYIDINFDEILMSLCSRCGDGVNRMIFEMNREKFESFFVIPTMSRLMDEIEASRVLDDVKLLCKYFDLVVVSDFHGEKYTVFPVQWNEKWAFFSIVAALYRNEFDGYGSDKSLKALLDADHQKIVDLIQKKRLEKSSPNIVVFGDKEDPRIKKLLDVVERKKLTIFLPVEDLQSTSLPKAARISYKFHSSILNLLKQRSEQRARKITDILGLNPMTDKP